MKCEDEEEVLVFSPTALQMFQKGIILVKLRHVG